MAMMGLFQPVPSVLPNPDGAISQADRQQFNFGYPGILYETPTLGVGGQTSSHNVWLFFYD